MSSPPSSVKPTLALIWMNAAIWLALGGIVALGVHPAMPKTPWARWEVTVLAVGCSACLGGLAVRLGRGHKLAYLAALALLTLLGVAILLDEVGVVDLVVLVVALAPVALLLRDRRWYLRA
jgi:hypothetical protein